jgi:AhpD family alkylhydroperoxidase
MLTKSGPGKETWTMPEQLYDKLRRLSPKVTGGLIRMRSDTFKDSAVPAKFKILSALAIVVATKCEPCIIGYTKMAYEVGTTEVELVEFLNVAITETGCPGEQWAMIALKTYSELEAGKRYVEADICCHDESTI